GVYSFPAFYNPGRSGVLICSAHHCEAREYTGHRDARISLDHEATILGPNAQVLLRTIKAQMSRQGGHRAIHCRGHDDAVPFALRSASTASTALPVARLFSKRV